MWINYLKKIICALFFCGAFAFGQQGGDAASSGGAIRTPLVVGGLLGFGSGTGVGADRGLGLYQIEPVIGLWYPRLGFLRMGYGFYNYNAEDDHAKYDVEHSDLDLELGIHLLGEVYVVGGYSRVKELSDVGDIAWNEWGVGAGTVLSIFSKSLFFAEVWYRHVLDHYDPFLDKNINGSRIQLNVGFSAYVY
ncbi:MAG: hypothetical protein HUK20_14540 [Fibrobacter sp.]|nr:hypothetical protein [Fibrobacter sp.]